MIQSILVRLGIRKAVAPEPSVELDAERAAEAVDPPEPLRWYKRAGIFCVLVIGWVFVLWQNKFHVTAPVVFVCIAYLAVVTMVVNLWRTGAAAVSPALAGQRAWGRPLGERGELEYQKKTLLKAIKEAEFDQQMGKLSQKDADELIVAYRARAIEIIKELERLEAGQAETVREQIAREVKARVEAEAAAKKAKKAAKAGKGDGAKAAKPDGKPAEKTDDVDEPAEAKPDEPAAAVAAESTETAPPADSATEATS